MIELDGGQFTELDGFLLPALSLAALSGRGVVIQNIGRGRGRPGLTALHLAALAALAPLCAAEVEGGQLHSRSLCFQPTQPPQPRDFVVDPSRATGLPSPAPVTPIAEALLPILARAEGPSLVELRGVNAPPHQPSALWLRETLLPMLAVLGLDAGLEVERWGWHPDGGGQLLMAVDGGWQPRAEGPSLLWDERGDGVALSALAAHSARTPARFGQSALEALLRLLASEPLPPMEAERRAVPSPGPGSALFLTLQCEQVVAGFEAVSEQGESAAQLAQSIADALGHFLWSDCAFEPMLARAMMIPLALAGRPAAFTTPQAMLPLRILAALIPQFLPVQVVVEPLPGAAARVAFHPTPAAG